MSKYVIHASDAGFRFELKAPNGQVVAASEMYDTMAACRKGIDSVRRNGPRAHLEDQTEAGFKSMPNPKFELFADKSGQFRFRLKARNGKIIAVSENYLTRSGCEKGIESVRANAPEAEITEE